MNRMLVSDRVDIGFRFGTIRREIPRPKSTRRPRHTERRISRITWPPSLEHYNGMQLGRLIPRWADLDRPGDPIHPAILLNGCRAARPARGWRDFLFLT